MAAYYSDNFVAARQRNGAPDWGNLVLAIWLFVSPWILAFGAGSGAAGAQQGSVALAAWDAWVMGVLTFLVALSAVSRVGMRQEWLEMIFGIWIFIAPWVLGFTQLRAASWDHWIVGVLVFLLALSGMSMVRGARTPMAPPQNPI